MAPLAIWEESSKLLTKLKSYYLTHEVSPPLISEWTALLCALLYTLLYVAPFYVSPTLRTSMLASRDASSVIRARTRAVGVTCLVCTTLTIYVLIAYGHATPRDVLRLLGMWPVNAMDIFKALALVVVLFVGPLYEAIVVDGDWRHWSFSAFREGIFDNWIGYRNLLISPASEELVFRADIIPLYILAKTSPVRIVFLTPFIFGLAHAHHLAEFLRSRTPEGQNWPPKTVWLMGIARTMFQFTYTSVFGFFAAFLFLRTGNLWAIIVAHSFCNWQGVPRLYGQVGQSGSAGADANDVTPGIAQGKRDDDRHEPAGSNQTDNKIMGRAAAADRPKDLGIAWTVIYYALLVLGAVGFYLLVWPLTKSSNALAMF